MKDKLITAENILGASNGSIYSLTILVAKRALQLADGDKAVIDKPGEKLLDNAMREIAEGRIVVKGKNKNKKKK